MPLSRSFSDSDLISSLSTDIAMEEYPFFHGSWPQLNLFGPDFEDPPDYNQLCLADLISLRCKQMDPRFSFSKSDSGNMNILSRSTSLISGACPKSRMIQTLCHEMGLTRKENLILANKIQNDSRLIESLMTKQQNFKESIDDFSSQIRKLEKKVGCVEEKIQLNCNETKLLYKDTTELQQNYAKIYEMCSDYGSTIAGSRASSMPNSPGVMIQNSTSNSGFQLRKPSNSSSASGLLSSSASQLSSSELSSNQNINADISVMQKQIEQLETRVQRLVALNSNMNVQLNQCIRKISTENAWREKMEHRLTYLSDFYQLLQVKVRTLEAKIKQGNDSNLNSDYTNPSIIAASKVLPDIWTHRSPFTIKMYGENLERSPYSTNNSNQSQIHIPYIETDDYIQDNKMKPVSSTTSDIYGYFDQSTPPVAYVFPNLRNESSQSIAAPHSLINQRSISLTESLSNRNNNNNSSLQGNDNQDNSLYSGNLSRHRRCHKRHKIRLFRRRH